MAKNPFLEEDNFTNPFLGETTPWDMDNVVSPLTGSVGSGFDDTRSGGTRKHLAVDYQAPAGSKFVAPTDLVYLRGGVSDGTAKNLPTPGDKWAHFGIPGTNVEWHIAHQGELPEPGTYFKQGERVGTIGSAIDKPHLHAGFVDTDIGEHIDIGSQLGLSRGLKIEAGQPLNPFMGTEQKMEATAGKVNPFLVEIPVGESNPFLEPSAVSADIQPETSIAMDPFAEAEVSGALSLAGKGLGWVASLPRKYITEPTVGKAYDKLAPLVGAPTDKGFVNVDVPADALVRPGEFGQVGGEPAEGTINVPAITPREILMSGIEAKGLGLLSRIPAIRVASKEGTLTRFPEMRKPELLWDNPKLGAVVYNKPYATKLDSTLGPAGTEVAGPVLREGHAVMSAQLADAKIAAPFSFGSKWKRNFATSLKPNERIMGELNDHAPGMKQWTWTDIKASENAGYRQTKIMEKEVDELAVAAGGHEVGDKLGVIAISEREPYGLQALKNAGITDIPTPTILDRTTINAIRNKYYGLLERINEGRAASGLPPVATDADYVTLMRNIVSHEINPVLATNAELKAALAVPFKFDVKVIGGKQKVATNLFDIYKNYAIQAERHLNISPHIAKINKFVLEEMVLPNGTKIAPLAETNPVIADALLQYAKSMSGRHGQAFTESWGWLERGISALSNNVVIAMLTAYPRSVINQFGALTGAAARVRPDRLIQGMNSALTPEGWKLAMTESRVVGQARMDVVFEDLFSGSTKALSELKHKGMLPLETTDMTTRVGTWNAGVLQAESMGLKGRKAYDWSDEMVTQSQGSASNIDRSNFQRTMMGKALSGLQTFTIADASLWAREILGFGNKNKTLMQRGASLASVLAVGIAMNLFYRHVMGMSPPNPEPIKAFTDAKEGGASNLSALGSAGMELASKYMPLVGSMAMGKTPFGPLGSLVSDISSGKKGLVEAGMSLGGVPATNILSRLYKTEPGMELRAKLEDLTTLPLAQRAELTLPPLTVKEALFGRLDYPSKGPGKWDLWLHDITNKKRKPTEANEFLRGLTGGD